MKEPASKKKAAFDPIRKPIPRFAEMTLEERVEAIREDPNYGQIFAAVKT